MARTSLMAGLAVGAFMAFAPIGATAHAQSGSAASERALHFSNTEAADFSKQVERDLAAQGARVAMVFRKGYARDELPDGIRYTHGAFWVYQAFQTPDGEVFHGYNTWNLFHGDGESLPRSQSFLAEEMPFEFVTGSAMDELGVIIPTPAMQARLLGLMAGDDYAMLHEADYSLISNPASPEFQNCNEFMLDVIAAAAWETVDRYQIKANLAAHFEPTTIDAGPLARLFGPMVDERLRVSDHRGGDIETVSYESITGFMMAHGLADEAYAITFDRGQQIEIAG